MTQIVARVLASITIYGTAGAREITMEGDGGRRTTIATEPGWVVLEHLERAPHAVGMSLYRTVEVERIPAEEVRRIVYHYEDRQVQQSEAEC